MLCTLLLITGVEQCKEDEHETGNVMPKTEYNGMMTVVGKIVMMTIVYSGIVQQKQQWR